MKLLTKLLLSIKLLKLLQYLQLNSYLNDSMKIIERILQNIDNMKDFENMRINMVQISVYKEKCFLLAFSRDSKKVPLNIAYSRRKVHL